jgi:hypothetical protein
MQQLESRGFNRTPMTRFTTYCRIVRRLISNSMPDLVVENYSRIGYVIEFKSGKVGGTGRQIELYAIV